MVLLWSALLHMQSPLYGASVVCAAAVFLPTMVFLWCALLQSPLHGVSVECAAAFYHLQRRGAHLFNFHLCVYEYYNAINVSHI